MRIILSYGLPSGDRCLVLVEVPDGDHRFSLLDIPMDRPLTPDADLRVVYDRIDDDIDAFSIGLEHRERSQRLGRPAEPYFL